MLAQFIGQFFFLFLYCNGFQYYYYYYFTLVYFDQFPQNVFQCDWCLCLCCHPLVWPGAHGWVVDTAGPGVVPSSRGWVAGQP